MAQQLALVQQRHVSAKVGARGWKTGQGWLTIWTPEMVAVAPDPVLAWSEYAQQVLGVPWPTIRDQAILRHKIRELFDHYPRADWYSLCRLVQWCKGRGKRDTRVWLVLDRFRSAWCAGALPELDPQRTEVDVEARIERALEDEADPTWRRRLLGAMGTVARRAAIDEWEGRWKSTTAVP